MESISILDDQDWLSPSLPPANPEFRQRLALAFSHLSDRHYNENAPEALRDLLEFGLTVDFCSDSQAEHSSVALAHNIADTLLNYTAYRNCPPLRYSFRLQHGPFITSLYHHSRLLLLHLSQILCLSGNVGTGVGSRIKGHAHRGVLFSLNTYCTFSAAC